MRISTQYQFDRYSHEVSRASEKYFNAQRTVSTGKRIEVFSDDVLGATTTVSMRALRKGIEGYNDNLKQAKVSLSVSDNALSETTAIINQANQLAIQGANSPTDQTGRQGMVSQIRELQRRLLDVANTRGQSGQYVFGGQKNDTPPLTVSGAVATFNGDTNPILVETDPTNTLQANITAGPQFKELYDRLETLKTNLEGGNLGAISGISLGELQDSLRKFNDMRGQVGARLQTVDIMSNQNSRRTDELSAGISDIEDVDLSEAILNYKKAEAAYQGALTVASKGFELSLMNFIR
jgi:flagellar hook-associated protein 3 FlgL